MNMVTPHDSNRKIPNLIMAKDERRGIETPWSSRYNPLDEELKKLCAHCDMGYEIYADTTNRRWIFDAIAGVDRTKAQSSVSPVFFSLESRNIGHYKYTEDYQDYSNTGYSGGAGEDERRLIYILGSENEGLRRHETFLDCGNVDLIDELIYYASQKLSEYKEAKTLETTALPRVFIFGRDYFIGDKVSVYISRLNLSLETRVTAVREIWERQTGYRTEMRLGGELPNLYTILKKSSEVR
jgi:hypothetical protein